MENIDDSFLKDLTPAIKDNFHYCYFKAVDPIFLNAVLTIFNSRNEPGFDLDAFKLYKSNVIEKGLCIKNSEPEMNIIGDLIDSIAEVLPATAAMIVSSDLKSTTHYADNSWFNKITKGLLKNGRLEQHETSSVLSLFSSIDDFFKSVKFDQSIDLAVEEKLPMIGVAYKACEADAKISGNFDDVIFVEQFFANYSAINNWGSMNQLSYQMLSSKLNGDDGVSISEKNAANVMNPIFNLFEKFSKEIPIFGDNLLALYRMKNALYSSRHEYPGFVFDRNKVASLVLNSLSMKKDQWRKILLADGSSAKGHLESVSSYLKDISAELSLIDVDNGLKTRAYSNVLANVANHLVRGRHKDEGLIDDLLCTLVPYADYDLTVSSMSLGAHNLLSGHIIRKHPLLLSKLSDKERGSALEIGLGL